MKYILFIFVISITLFGCNKDVEVSGSINSDPPIYPDYKGVTIPPNIAPLNFSFIEEGEYVALIRFKDDTHCIYADANDIVFPEKLWRETLSQAHNDSIKVTVCRKIDNEWKSYNDFYIHVSSDEIDNTLVYRLIPPLYGTWREIGIYQRDLESYDETPIYKNISYHGNCVNCHSFCNREAEKMMFHLRGPGGGTYLMDNETKYRLDTKTDSTISNFTYPYWHPSGKYIAYSVNDIFQIFHTTDANRTEVIDDASDVIVYNIAEGKAVSCPYIKSTERMETFPAFSPDGKTLYFCSADKPGSLPEHYDKVKYSLCSISFNPDNCTFGNVVDTLFNAETDSLSFGPRGSVSVPRPSPNGKYLVATFSEYGQFKIWHKDADLWIYDIANRKWSPMGGANSDDVDSYHSWSSNSRWMVLSSRRDDGLYTRPYIVHIDAEGKAAKAFMLPQKHPKKYYTDQENSYNIPELVSSKVDLTTQEVVDWIDQPIQKVTYKQ